MIYEVSHALLFLRLLCMGWSGLFVHCLSCIRNGWGDLPLRVGILIPSQSCSSYLF
jgi:hypothetical protein